MHQPELSAALGQFSGIKFNSLKDLDQVKSAIDKESINDWKYMESLDAIKIDDNGSIFSALVIPAHTLRDPSDRKEIIGTLKRLANNPAVIKHITDKTGFDAGMVSFIISNNTSDLPDGTLPETPIGLTYERLGPETDIKFNPTLLGATGGNSITHPSLNEAFQAEEGPMQIALMSELRLAHINGLPVYIMTKTKDLRGVIPTVYDTIVATLNGRSIIDAGHLPTREQITAELNKGLISPIKAGDRLATKFLDKTSPALLSEAQNYIALRQPTTGEVEFVDGRETDGGDTEFERTRDAINVVLDYVFPNTVREMHAEEKQRVV
jgi:hypothetical protein